MVFEQLASSSVKVLEERTRPLISKFSKSAHWAPSGTKAISFLSFQRIGIYLGLSRLGQPIWL